jgi:hypothetical protein
MNDNLCKTCINRCGDIITANVCNKYFPQFENGTITYYYEKREYTINLNKEEKSNE